MIRLRPITNVLGVLLLIILLVFVIAIAAMLFVTESALNVWDRLVQGPRILLYGYIAVMAALVVAAFWLVMRLVVRRKVQPNGRAPQKLKRADIEARIREAERNPLYKVVERETVRGR